VSDLKGAKPSPTRVLAIGLDAADPRLLLEWSEDGTMPRLASLRREGAFCRISTPPGLGDDAVWGSLSTGVSPARHGRFYYRGIDSASYDAPYKDTTGLACEPFWSQLARRGRRVAVIDAPKCGLSREPNAVQILDWRCHGRSALPESQPPELVGEVLARFGDDRTDVYGGADRRCFLRALALDDAASFVTELKHSIDKKREASEWLLARGGWDLFLTVFKEAHCVGHLCWGEGDEHRAMMRPIYRELDHAVGRLVDEVDARTPVFVFSDLGMGPNYSGNDFLSELLLRLERRVIPSRVALRLRLASFRRRRVTSRDSGDREAARARASRAFYAVDHNEMSGAIRVNVVGRERFGVVRRGRELEEICSRLTGELRALTRPDDARPLVDRVIRCSDVYSGEHLDELPDLLVVWNRDAPIHGAASPTIGQMRAEDPGLRPGNHLEGGILFVRSPGVPRGHRLEDVDVVDLASTFAALVGVELGNVEGRAIDGLSRDPHGGDDPAPP
jgi:predicted AlkP superfamily phosphohydrolase/phosphomutase